MAGGDSDTSEARQTHRARTQEVFAHQASSFEAAGSILTDRGVLDWICRPLPNEPNQTVLDVAGGTGQLGRHLARRGGLAVIADLTSRMLQEGARAAREMARVCRAGGTVAVVDMVSEPGETAERHNELERLRDPSHPLALEEAELLRVLREAKVSAGILGERTIEQRWLIVGGVRG